MCAPDTIGNWSAVGYFFARQLHLTLDVPVGMINNAWGGSACEAWVRRDILSADEKRFRSFVRIMKGEECVATVEQLCLHVDMKAGKTVAAAQTGWWATHVSFAAVFGVATGLSLLFLGVLVPLARTAPPPPGEPQAF